MAAEPALSKGILGLVNVTLAVQHQVFEDIAQREFEKAGGAPAYFCFVDIDFLRSLNVAEQALGVDKKGFDDLLAHGLMGKIVSFGRFSGYRIGEPGSIGGPLANHGVFYLFSGLPSPGFGQVDGAFHPGNIHLKKRILVGETLQGIPGVQVATCLQRFIGLIGNLVPYYFKHVAELGFEAIQQVVLHNSLQK